MKHAATNTGAHTLNSRPPTVGAQRRMKRFTWREKASPKMFSMIMGA